MSSKWQNYIQEFIKQFQVYIFAVVYFGLFRIVMIFYFHDKLDSSTGLGDIFLAMAHGFRFDSAIAVLFLLIPFLANTVFSPLNLSPLTVYLRIGFLGFMVIAMTSVFVVTIPYFKEYDSQFDYFLFEILYDDRSAVMQTVIDEYNFFSSLLIFSVVSIFCFFLIKQWQKLSFTPLLRILTKPKKLFPRCLIIIVIVCLTSV